MLNLIHDYPFFRIVSDFAFSFSVATFAYKVFCNENVTSDQVVDAASHLRCNCRRSAALRLCYIYG